MKNPDSPPGKHPGGRPKFVKDPKTAQLVELHAAMGTPLDEISKIVEVNLKTLSRHFKKETSLGRSKATARVAARLYQKAIDGDNTCMIFWLKTRAGWRETERLEVVANPDKAMDDYTDEELIAIIEAERRRK